MDLRAPANHGSISYSETERCQVVEASEESREEDGCSTDLMDPQKPGLKTRDAEADDDRDQRDDVFEPIHGQGLCLRKT